MHMPSFRFQLFKPQFKKSHTHGSRRVSWFAAVAFVLVLPLNARAEFIDHIVAAVNNDVITWSELRQAVDFNRAVAGAAGDEKTMESETLEGLINRRLLIQEARRLKFADVSEQEVGEEVERFKKRFASEKAFNDFLAGLGMTVEQLGRMLGERLFVERFVEKKIGLFVRVERDEAQQYFDSHPAEFKGMRFQDAYKSIIALLTEKKTGQELTQYLAELRSKADIRLNSLT